MTKAVMMINKMHNTLPEWLSYLETLHPQAIDLGLTRVKEVAQRLNLQHPAKKVITVAGTNGKGSCVASLTSIYLQAGYQVASYTSPHLWHFAERILINGIPVAEEKICEAFAIIDQIRVKISLTYFEFTTLAALWIFQQHDLDIAILEVGMGGRLDAVNIIDADIAVITSIDFDHQEWLGDTREKIGYEKAGILRAGCPLVCGRAMPSSVLQAAQIQDVPVYELGKAFDVKILNTKEFTWKNAAKTFANLPRNHLLVDNIALSLMVLDLLEGHSPVSAESIASGLAHCSLVGRQQVIVHPIWQLFDVAHNPQGIAALADTLQREPGKGKTRAVFSMLRDKDVRASVAVIDEQIDEWYVAGLEVARGMSTTEIADQVRAVTKKPVQEYASVVAAFQAAVHDATVEKDRVVIFGSFYTVGLTHPAHPAHP